MTNEYNFKVGDRVHIHDGKEVYTITEICNGLYRLSDGKGLWGDKYLTLVEPYDRKTAFLRELQALLRKYDARIYDGEMYAIHIELGYHNAESEQIDYLFFNKEDDDSEVNADNITDFDKE